MSQSNRNYFLLQIEVILCEVLFQIFQNDHDFLCYFGGSPSATVGLVIRDNIKWLTHSVYSFQKFPCWSAEYHSCRCFFHVTFKKNRFALQLSHQADWALKNWLRVCFFGKLQIRISESKKGFCVFLGKSKNRS